MPATVTIDESNGVGEDQSADIANLNFGSVDSTELVAATYPITAGENSFEKWVRFHVTAMGGVTKVLNLRVWRTGALGAEATLKTNAREAGYEGAQTYAQPSATDRSETYDYDQDMPSSEPSGANLGIGGALDGEITEAGYSDYLVSQIQTTGSATAGASITLSFEWDEVA